MTHSPWLMVALFITFLSTCCICVPQIVQKTTNGKWYLRFHHRYTKTLQYEQCFKNTYIAIIGVEYAFWYFTPKHGGATWIELENQDSAYIVDRFTRKEMNTMLSKAWNAGREVWVSVAAPIQPSSKAEFLLWENTPVDSDELPALTKLWADSKGGQTSMQVEPKYALDINLANNQIEFKNVHSVTLDKDYPSLIMKKGDLCFPYMGSLSEATGDPTRLHFTGIKDGEACFDIYYRGKDMKMQKKQDKHEILEWFEDGHIFNLNKYGIIESMGDNIKAPDKQWKLTKQTPTKKLFREPKTLFIKSKPLPIEKKSIPIETLYKDTDPSKNSVYTNTQFTVINKNYDRKLASGLIVLLKMWYRQFPKSVPVTHREIYDVLDYFKLKGVTKWEIIKDKITRNEWLKMGLTDNKGFVNGALREWMWDSGVVMLKVKQKKTNAHEEYKDVYDADAYYVDYGEQRQDEAYIHYKEKTNSNYPNIGFQGDYGLDTWLIMMLVIVVFSLLCCVVFGFIAGFGFGYSAVHTFVAKRNANLQPIYYTEP